MKRVLSSLVFAASILVFGCQDSSINGPTDQVNPLGKPSPHSGILLLKGTVSKPSPGSASDVYEITGQAEYFISRTEVNGVPGFELSLDVNAELVPKDVNKQLGVVNGQTTEKYVLDGKSSTTLTKQFAVQGTERGMALHMKFDVTDQTASIGSMWLSPVAFNHGDATL
jgi:hypothetical protein